jgi:hypothetical protein
LQDEAGALLKRDRSSAREVRRNDWALGQQNG